MKNYFVRFFTIILSICILLSNSNVAFAKTVQTNPKNVLFTVEVKNDAELKSFLSDLDKHNKASQEKWKEALKQSNNKYDTLSSNTLSSTASTVSKSVSVMNRIEKDVNLGVYTANLGAYVEWERVSSSGYYTFGTIYDMSVYGRDSDTTVSGLKYRYTRIDGNRTLATNSSCLVGVKNWNGDFEFYPFSNYIEFYAKGYSGWWKDGH